LPPQKSDIDRLGNPLAISRLLWPLYAAGRPQCRPSSSVEQPWVAPVLALFTIIAALAFHTGFADQNQAIHFMKNVAIAGGLMAVYAAGAGAWSADAMFGRTRPAAALA